MDVQYSLCAGKWCRYACRLNGTATHMSICSMRSSLASRPERSRTSLRLTGVSKCT